MTEEELSATFTSLCKEHGLNVLIDPTDYTIKSPAAIDVEHDEQGNLVGIGIYDGQRSLYFTEVTEDLDIELQNLDFIAHNGLSDFDLLRQWGLLVSDKQLIWDSMLIGHILDSSVKSYGLKDMAKRELSIEYPEYVDIVGKHKGKTKNAPKCPQIASDCCGRVTLEKQSVELVSRYCCMDAFVTYKLYEKQAKLSLAVGSRDASTSQYFNDVEKPASKVFASMENRGLRIDVSYLKQLKLDLEEKQEPIKKAIRLTLGDINLNSPKQLLEALHAKGIKPQLKGKPSTDKRALDQYRDKGVVEQLLCFSELDTLLSSFVYSYLERQTEVVHPRFSQTGTRTGRPSCSNPNLLQIPRRTDNGKLVRRMFVPRPGMLMGDCDFGQIEPRVLAHLSKDPTLCQMFNEGIDFHTFTSERLGISRERAKVLNLSVGYRATFKSVMAQLGVSKEEAQSQINKWWSLFPTLRRWQDSLIYDSKRSGFCTTLLGRRIKVDGLSDSNSWKREAAERQLINNITQGSAAEIMKLALIKLHNDKRVSPSFGILVTVYDEILAESPEMEADIEFMKEDMVTSLKLDIPLVVDAEVGRNWSDAH